MIHVDDDDIGINGGKKKGEGEGKRKVVRKRS